MDFEKGQTNQSEFISITICTLSIVLPQGKQTFWQKPL